MTRARQTSATWSRIRRSLIGVVLVGGAALAFVASWDHDGPARVVAIQGPHATTSITLDIHREAAFVAPELVVPGGEFVTLRAVEPISATRSAGLTVVRVIADSASPRPIDVSSGDTFPYDAFGARGREVRGVLVPTPDMLNRAAGHGLRLIFDLRAERAGRWHLSGLRLTYDVDGRPAAQVIPVAVDVCAPRSACHT